VYRAFTVRVGITSGCRRLGHSRNRTFGGFVLFSPPAPSPTPPCRTGAGVRLTPCWVARFRLRTFSRVTFIADTSIAITRSSPAVSGESSSTLEHANVSALSFALLFPEVPEAPFGWPDPVRCRATATLPSASEMCCVVDASSTTGRLPAVEYTALKQRTRTCSGVCLKGHAPSCCNDWESEYERP